MKEMDYNIKKNVHEFLKFTAYTLDYSKLKEKLRKGKNVTQL